MTEIFLGTFETLLSVKRAIDDGLDAGSDAPAPDNAMLEGLLDASARHAALTRKLQDMMFDHGAEDSFHYEVELLREGFENTKSEIGRRLSATRETCTPAPRSPRPSPQPHQEHPLRPESEIRVFHRDVRYGVRIVDVSESGARLRLQERLPAGAWVSIRYLHLSIRAQVEWSDDTSATLQFRAPPAPEDLHVLQGALTR